MNERFRSQRIVLWGVGHTNAHVLRMWGLQRFSDTELVCVSNFPKATYSGMLPGVLAGQYPASAIEIDLVGLCQQNGAQLIVEEVTGVNLAERSLQFRERPPLPFDALSVGIGSVPTTSGVLFAPQAQVLQLKPMQTLSTRLQQTLSAVAANRPASPLRIAIVGGGAAGVEVALCLRRYVKKTFETFAEVCLVHAGEEVLPGVTTGLRQRVQRELDRSGILVHTGRRVVSVEVEYLHCDDGYTIEADVVLWAAGAVGPSILSQLGLPTEERGFLQTDSTLSVCGHPGVFAVGDSGTIQNTTMAKAGVYAVREGPVLWNNLFCHLTGTSMRRYVPQHSFMKLLNFGDGRAAGEWRGFSFEGKWVWWLKNWIDTAFMKKFRVADT
ncbi:MAG: FAD-dependent oxidoreductase [Planctomycetaceae bacterium]|nr:FAD-dependent oxidoreductase [Planctomycetaceae bacterium]MCB9950726.1 FAD-dependent oxidoreductase [Planctomycetaceae bacterium]